MADPYSIEVFVASGDPEGLRVVSQKAWSVECLVFPRTSWQEAQKRAELQKTGVYILAGYPEDDSDIPLLYIGHTDNLKKRLNQHESGSNKKLFWTKAVVLTASNDFLNVAYAGRLERLFYERALEMENCILDNDSTPPQPSLSEAEEATVQTYAKHVMQILPLVGITAFEEKKIIKPKQQKTTPKGDWRTNKDMWDTVIVPAKKEGFNDVFLGENRWYSIRIGGGMLNKLKYIAAYQVKPVMAITHVAEIDHIEPYGDTGKYALIFKGPPREISQIPYGGAPSGAMQGPRYTNFDALQNSKTVKDILFG